MIEVFTSPRPKTRTVRTHEPWQPWGYQARAVRFLVDDRAEDPAALFLDPGLGKTSIVLEAFRVLQERGEAKRMLVVAPLRVCQLVWRQEGQKWSQFRHLRFALLHGKDKGKRLKEDADIYLINPEGVQWLMKEFYGRSDLPFDVLTLDELTKFKNYMAIRSKQLRKKIHGITRRWGLTGTPAPNGYMDLFGQMLMLDDGAALGRHITFFRDQYFIQGFTGFDWKLRNGAARQIEERIAPMVLRMAAADYMELPEVRDNIIPITLPPGVVRHYEAMKETMLADLPEGVVTAANAGAVYSKLAQMANGAVYIGDQKEYAEIHGAKLDALEDLIEELAGQPLLVAYEFQHDLVRIRERLGKDTPCLAGLGERQITALEAAWNRDEVPVLLAHPASMGHGLNLQQGSGSHICWFSQVWDWELVDQMIRRLRRQGSSANSIANHILCVTGLHEPSMDELKIEALADKDTTQQGFLTRMNSARLRDDPSPIATGRVARQEDSVMPEPKRLGFRGNAAPAQEPAAATGSVRPRGWGAAAKMDDDGGLPSAADDTAGDPNESIAQEVAPQGARRPRGWGSPAEVVGAAEDTQRERIASKIAAPQVQDDDDEEEPAANRALAAFGPGIVGQLTGDEEGGSPEPQAAEPAKRTRGRRAAAEPAEQSGPVTTGSASAANTLQASFSGVADNDQAGIGEMAFSKLAASLSPSFTINVNVKLLFPPEIMALAKKLTES